MIAYLDCYSGISGDMTLGSLVDAGLDPDELRAALASLPVAGYTLRAEPFTGRGLAGTQVTVDLEERDQPHRHLSDVEAIIDGSSFTAAVKARAKAVFRRLAEAEAHVHGEPMERVHFHEVGAVDAIVDVVGAVWGFDRLGVERAFVSPLPTGSGKVRSAHGPIPVPAPATLEIARRAGAPLVPSTAETELVTPTGAALAAELGEFRQPPMTVARVGYGFGRKELPWANALRLWLGHPTGASASDEVSLLETNLDDMSPELLGATLEQLLRAGALDVFFTPIQMKKNRPGTMLSAIVPVDREGEFAALILRETTTLGVRVHRRHRYKADRRSATADTPWGPVRVKVKSLDGRETAAPEYDDCLRVAREQNVPIADVYEAARRSEPRNDAR